ncbi:hypothetical protein [Embleya sp. NPDC059237]|uniref:hypothetical protein n=1 Tax=Embleya sp. NPDC059237 TaxID=3346784 RepID=UPI00369E30E1
MSSGAQRSRQSHPYGCADCKVADARGRGKRRHVLDAAQAARNVLGEEITVPEQRWYESSLLQEIVTMADEKATEIGGEYEKELGAERDAT